MKDDKNLSRGLWMFSLLKNLLEKNDLKRINILDLVEGIRTGKINNVVFVHYIMELRDPNVSAERKRIIKTKLLPAVVSSGVCTGTVKADNFGWHNGFVQCDFDPTDINKKIFGETLIEVQNFINTVLSKDEFTCVAFLSPSGWIKLLVRISPDNPENKITHLKEAQSVYLKIIARYFKDNYGLEMDMACSDVSRLMLLSYDPDVYYNKDSKQFRIDMGLDILEEELTKTHRQKVRATSENKGVNVSDVEWAVSQVEERGVNITAGYERWMLLSFSFASLNEKGRSFFHRISKIDPVYSKSSCDKQFDNALNSFDPSRSSIATFFYFCKEFGITINNKKSKTMNNDNNKSERISNQPLPDSIYLNLPPLLQKIVEPFFDSERKRDVILLSAISAISSAILNVYGLYRGHKVMTNFYVFISAPAASDKSVATFSTLLLEGINKQLQNETINGEKDYKRMLTIPENISAAGANELISYNKNCFLFSSEADTLSNQKNQEWGDWIDLMCKLFHHESNSTYRKTEGFVSSIKAGEGRLSVDLTGTPKQLPRMVEHRESGTFSRFWFYVFSEKRAFEDPFSDETDLSEYFTDLGDEVLEMYNKLNSLEKERKFVLNKEQQKKFVQNFQDEQGNIELLGESIDDVLFRLALGAFRFAMLLSTLRDIEGEGDLTCTDEDLDRALLLSRSLINNAIEVLSMFEKNKPISRNEMAYNSLPNPFRSSDVSNAFGEVIRKRQGQRIRKDWEEKGWIREIKNGLYEKIKQ